MEGELNSLPEKLKLLREQHCPVSTKVENKNRLDEHLAKWDKEFEGHCQEQKKKAQDILDDFKARIGDLSSPAVLKQNAPAFTPGAAAAKQQTARPDQTQSGTNVLKPKNP